MSDREREFFERHKDAHYLVFDTRDHRCIGAVYYAPGWDTRPEVIDAELKRFFTLVRAAEFGRQKSQGEREE